MVEADVARCLGGHSFPVVDGESPIALLTTLLSRTTPAALVRRNGKVVGIVSRYDLLHQLAGIR